MVGLNFRIYVATSVALACGVVLKAFHERPNFYSASIYLTQSNACLMILANLLLLCLFGFMTTLQRLLFGPLRPIERETLYEKSWMALTETCLAMATFRDEIGGWFFFMFIALLVGKVWCWLTETRVEYIEQHVPHNQYGFHVRLAASVFLSVSYDVLMLRYCVLTVIEEARPGMMVMFVFEFAVLLILSVSAMLSYLISLKEKQVLKRLSNERLETRRALARERRIHEARQANIDVDVDSIIINDADLELEDDIEDPVWEEKSRWKFILELGTEFFKLIVYLAFFSILIAFHGIPLHIMRDVAITAVNLVRKIHDFMKYRRATCDMENRYRDATAQELMDSNTCIVCRDEMRVWPTNTENETEENRRLRGYSERMRPKKLPCGHILHFGCLRSWLERQQVCPICRRPTSDEPATTTATTPATSNSTAAAAVRDNNLDHNSQSRQANEQNGSQVEHNPRNGRLHLRQYRFGPLRVVFGTGPPGDVVNLGRELQEADNGSNLNGNPANRTMEENLNQSLRDNEGESPLAREIANLFSRHESTNRARAVLNDIERTINSEIAGMQFHHQHLGIIRALHDELDRLRDIGASEVHGRDEDTTSRTTNNASSTLHTDPITGTTSGPANPLNIHASVLPHGHSELPEGVTVPEGWNVIPLHRIPSSAITTQTLRGSGGIPPFGNSIRAHVVPSGVHFPGFMPPLRPYTIPDSNLFTGVPYVPMASSSVNMISSTPVAFMPTPTPTVTMTTTGTSIPAPSETIATDTTSRPATNNEASSTMATVLEPSPTPTSSADVAKSNDIKTILSEEKKGDSSINLNNILSEASSSIMSEPLTNSMQNSSSHVNNDEITTATTDATKSHPESLLSEAIRYNEKQESEQTSGSEMTSQCQDKGKYRAAFVDDANDEND